MNILPLPAFTDNYIWLIEENGKATVVDPGDAEVVNNCLKEKNLENKYKISRSIVEEAYPDIEWRDRA